MIVMTKINNSKPPPPAALAITTFVFDAEPPMVGTSSGFKLLTVETAV